ncbi:MAG: lysostaphin resistance A-like protein [Thermoanaerobaculia bacterium]
MSEPAAAVRPADDPLAPPSESAILRAWRRIPRPLRALLSGLFVFSVLQNGWMLLFVANMQVAPQVPWSIPLGAAWLWFFFRWFGGRWAPASTSAARERAMRARWPGRRQWLWSIFFLPIFLGFLVSVINVFYRFAVIPEESFDISMLPWWTLYPCLVMLSVNAGVSEEAGFRGYLQGGLERSFGPVVAVLATSFAFWVAHLNHESGPARFVQLMAMAIGLGALTRAAGSIWPAIVAHATVDTIFFVTSAAEAAPWFIQHPPPFAETGVDGTMLFFAGMIFVSGLAGAFVLRRLAALRDAAAAENDGSATVPSAMPLAGRS